MMLELKNRLEPEARLELTINPEEAPSPIHATARVIWSNKDKSQEMYNTGIEIANIEEDNKNSFLKLLCDVIYRANP